MINMNYKFSVERKKDFYDLPFDDFLKGEWLKQIKEIKKDWGVIEIEYSKELLIIRKSKENK